MTPCHAGAEGDLLAAEVSAAFDDEIQHQQNASRRHAKLLEDCGYSAGFRFPQRPLFVSSDRLRAVERDAALLLSAIRKVPRLAFDDDPYAMARYFGWPHRVLPWLAALYDPAQDSHLARPEFCLTGEGGAGFFEQNISSAIGGVGGAAMLCRSFDHHPVTQALRARYQLSPLSPIGAIGAMIRSRYGGGQIAFIDAIDLETRQPWDSEGELLVWELRQAGVPIHYARARNLRVDRRGVWLGDARIETVFRGFLGSRIEARFDELLPLLRAAADGKVRMLDNPCTTVLFDKRMLALVSSPRIAAQLDGEERAALTRCLPWTQVLQAGEVVHQGRRVELLELVLERRDRFVLKRGPGFAGTEVVMGSQLKQQRWSKALRGALEQGDWIVQERLAVERVRYPYFVEDRLLFRTVPQVHGAFMVDNRLAGWIARAGKPRATPLLGSFGTAGVCAFSVVRR